MGGMLEHLVSSFFSEIIVRVLDSLDVMLQKQLLEIFLCVLTQRRNFITFIASGIQRDLRERERESENFAKLYSILSTSEWEREGQRDSKSLW